VNNKHGNDDLRGLIVYRASRLEALLEPLETLLQAAPPQRALAPHSVIAAHPGMQRWLSRALAIKRGPRGIVANLRIELPSAWLDRLALQLLGEEAIALRPYRREILRWRIHESLDAGDDARLRCYLEGESASRAQRRFQLADRLARIFTRYLVYRPDWLQSWGGDGGGAPHDAILAPLWRTLRRAIDRPHRGETLARLLGAIERTQAGAFGDDPLHVFGIAHLAPSELAVLRAVARHRPVVLYVPDPCREFWGLLRGERVRLRELVNAQPDAAETEAAFLEQGHPLLAAWGRMGQQFLLALDDSGIAVEERHWQDKTEAPLLETRLQRVQESIRQLKPELIGEGADFGRARADRSLRVHVCHTRLRELEALRDALLRERKENPELKPSDIVVMMPDIHAYLPLLPTVFGEAGRHEGPLPYHCFDVAVARAHPLFSAFRLLLDLPQSRVTAPEVVDLLAVPQIARRLGLGPGDDDVLVSWLKSGRVAWALDAAFRTRFDVPAIAEHTFAWGLERMLAGYVCGVTDADEVRALMLPDGAVIVPLEGVHGPQAALLGALDSLLLEIDAWCRAAAMPRPASAWANWLEQRFEALFAIDPTDRDAREAKAFVLRFVRAVASEPAESGLDPLLAFEVVREVLLDRLDAVPEQQRFLLGGVTFCGMVPQRSIPFDVVAVLGLDDGEFPRGGSDGGLDLMATRRRLGDRDTRGDDRYLFLETVMSARSVLHLSFVGEGVRDARPRNPAPPLAELMAALDGGRAASAADDSDPDDDGAAERERRERPWLIRHPLQPFDPRYFDRSDDALFSFRADFAAMRADPMRREDPAPFVATRIADGDLPPPPAEASIELRDVLAYYKDPARQLLTGALKLRLDAVDDGGLRDSETLAPRTDAIERVARRLFEDAVRRPDLKVADAAPDWLRLTGILPPGRDGSEAWALERAQAADLVAAVAGHELFAGGLPRPRPTTVDIELELSQGSTRLRGELRRVHEKNDALWIMDCYPRRDATSKLDFKARIAFFLEWALLRLRQADDRRPLRATVVVAGEHDDGWQRGFDLWNAQFERERGARTAMLDDLARRVTALVEFWQRSQYQPQWYFPVTSWAAAIGGIDGAREAWLGATAGRGKKGEREYSPGYARLLAGDRDFGDGADFATLLANARRLRALIDLHHDLAGDA
jgi:exodeoxyribonuclease V gamma subunit